MRPVFAALLGSFATGCTLLVSTSDLAGGSLSGTDGGPNVIADGAVATNDGGVEPGIEAGSEGGVQPAPGLVGAWLFDDDTARDSSGASHDGVLEGDAVISATERGKAMQLAGNGTLDVPGLQGQAFPKSGTLSVWFKWTSMSVAMDYNVLDGWEKNRDHVFIRKGNDQDPGEMQVALQSADGSYRFVTTYVVAANTWSHLVLTWNRDLKRAAVFVDAKLLVSEEFFEFTPADQHAVFGANWKGYLDDIRLFDRALTDDEAKALP